MVDEFDWISGAALRIAPYVRRTPLTYYLPIGLVLKCENREVTASLEVRGAVNKAMGLNQQELARGEGAASAGIHGIGVAYAAGLR